MKINKLTSALIGLGIISLVGTAYANNPVIYFTGSTAARANIFTAATTAGQIFDTGHAGYPKIVSPAPNNANNSSQIVFEGYINGTLTDLDCDWSGSEAGIAAVAGQTIQQTLNLDPNGKGPYNLPGVPPSFLTQDSGWTTASQLPIDAGVSTPDLTMADTSQAVSRTPESQFPLTDYGRVAIVPFTLMKGYEAIPDAAWNDVKNITTAQINQFINAPVTANFVTGIPTDSSDYVAACGRNFGSGTRANALLNFQYGITTPVDQYAYDADYPSATPGVLTFENNYAAGQSLVEVGDDGFDSGGSVANVMCVDGTGSGVVLIGYLGISDAANANIHKSGGGSAAYLPYNGVYESDSGVINGSYTYWGQEHLLGSIGQSLTSLAGETGTAIVNGLNTQFSTFTPATGAVGPVYSAQNALIPVSAMQVKRGTDGGFPSQGTF